MGTESETSLNTNKTAESSAQSTESVKPVKKTSTTINKTGSAAKKVSAPAKTADTATKKVSTPAKTAGSATKKVSAPAKTTGTVTKKISTTAKTAGTATKKVSSPTKTAGTATKKVSSPTKTAGTATKKVSSPTKTAGTATKKVSSPAKTAGTTAKKVSTPALTTDAAVKKVSTPAKKPETVLETISKDEGLVYDDYYDLPSRKKRSENTLTVVIASAVILAVLALIVVGLYLMNPGAQKPTDLVTASPISHSDPVVRTINGGSEAPAIYGINPIVVYAGNPVSYKDGVYVEDDTDENPVLDIDNSEVDLTKPGTYVVTYIASDKDDNITRAFSTVTVMPGADLISDDEIYALADKILETIIPDDTLSDEMKCLKVYEFLHSIGYVDEVHSEDWMQNAYWMLTKREGDCFCYYSAARLLLTRLGYDVMEVRNNNNYVHYWCLVSIDGGDTWWHFDACCWSWGEDGIVCLVSDKYLQEFTRRHYTSDGRLIHAWDPTKYPTTPEEDFWTDEDRSVIYENGMIDIYAQYDDSIWENDGWENYELPYAYEIPEEYYEEYYEDDYEVYYEDTYIDPGEPDWEEPDWEEPDWREPDWGDSDWESDDLTEDDPEEYYYEDTDYDVSDTSEEYTDNDSVYVEEQDEEDVWEP